VGIEVRTITADEHEAWTDSMISGFLDHTPAGMAAFSRPFQDLSRAWGAFDGDKVVGTARSFASELTVPGGAVIPSAALTNVTVQATHRRQGLARRMVEPDLIAARERGEPVGMLIAAEFPIYGRFGYGSATDHVTYEVDARTVRFLADGPGTVEMIDLGTLRREGPPLYERFRHAQSGAIERNDRWWDVAMQIAKAPNEKRWKGFIGLYRNDAGEPQGYVRYRVDNTSWDARRPDLTLEVDELLATTSTAYARLWRFCCDIDWVARVEAPDRSVDELLPWIVADARHVVQKWRADFLWVRVLDPAVALAARTYLAPGRVVLETTDPLGLAAGRYVLDGGPDGASCQATDESPGLTIPVDALSAAYLGGPSLRTLARAGRLDVHDDAALATADAMFRGAIAPWCTTWF
jgi:predicted acetyltransferase